MIRYLSYSQGVGRFPVWTQNLRVWRKSRVYTAVAPTWQDGASLTEINTARQLLIQDMKVLDVIAPESGAYSNGVRHPHVSTIFQPIFAAGCV